MSTHAFLAVALAGMSFCATACAPADARAVPGASVARGKRAVDTFGCGACHVIAGVPGARGQVAPPLTGVARRAYIAGTLPNTPENMVRWLEDPQLVEPGTAMPNLGIDASTARDIAAYLYTLR